MIEDPGNQQLLLIRREYIRLARELEQKGLSQDLDGDRQIALTEWQDDRWYIKPIAYLPTGVALGCSLPNPRMQRLLFRIARLIEGWVKGCDDSDRPAFAFVPAPMYHITIVNRSHYEFNEVVPLTGDEKSDIACTVSGLNIKNVSLVTGGLFLTQTGRIFLKCYTLDDTILDMRTMLTKMHPQLRTNVPRLVHIKIGHLMKGLTSQELLEFHFWLDRLGCYTVGRLDFTDLYTPAGRIPL